MMNIELDETSLLISCDSDVKLTTLAQWLNARHLQLGFYAPGAMHLSLEEVISEGYKNFYSLYYGELKDLCVAFDFVDNASNDYKTHLSPKQATGPCYKNLLIGAKRKLGLIYRVHLRVFPQIKTQSYSLIGLPSLQASIDLEKTLTRKELVPFCFNRLSHSSLPEHLQNQKYPVVLLMEWAGLPSICQAAYTQLISVLGKVYHHRLVDDELNKEKLFELIRKKMPDPFWAGEPFIPSSENVEVFIENLSEHLCPK